VGVIKLFSLFTFFLDKKSNKKVKDKRMVAHQINDLFIGVRESPLSISDRLSNQRTF